jgi:hypothetical protein
MKQATQTKNNQNSPKCNISKKKHQDFHGLKNIGVEEKTIEMPMERFHGQNDLFGISEPLIIIY